MKLAFIGTGKIIADALFAIEPIKEIEKTAIFARPHSKEKAEAFASRYIGVKIKPNFKPKEKKHSKNQDREK